MTYEPSAAAAFLRRLLASPGERGEVDYKSSLPFERNDNFTLNLIRHIQGMANAGGGWLVIGFTETGGPPPSPDPNHKDIICRTYDPTRVSGRIDSSIARGQRIRLTVYFEAHPDTGLQHPIIRVEGFERVPYICRSNQDASDTGGRILRQGVVYLRRHSAATSEVSTPEDWEELISRCMRVRRDEFLAEFRDLFERMSSPTLPEIVTVEQFHDWIDRTREEGFRTR